MKKIGIFAERGLLSEIFKERIKKIKEKIIILKNRKIKKEVVKAAECFVIVNCKDSKFSIKIMKKLKKLKWNGYFLDASSAFRKKKDATICLDPFNKKEIIKNIKKGKKIFCGANCTVSLLIMSILKVIKNYKIKRIFCNTYQCITGAGFKETKKLIKNYSIVSKIDKKNSLLDNIKRINEILIEKKNYINYGLIPWIGKGFNLNSEEEIKTQEEYRKITKEKTKIFSNCIRTSILRCHAEQLIINFKKKIKKKNIIKLIKKNKYVVYIKNNIKCINKLNPTKVSMKKKIYLGRFKKISEKEISIFIVGDQLLWGACEPLYRALKIILKENDKKN